MALCNLKCELVRNGVTQAEVAEFLGMGASNFNKKIAEAVPFTADEIKAVRDRFLPSKTLDYLLESDGYKPSKESRAIARVNAVADAMLEGCEDDPETGDLPICDFKLDGEAVAK